MNIKDYLSLMADRITKAGDTGNKEEAVRMFELVKEECDEQIRRITKVCPKCGGTANHPPGASACKRIKTQRGDKQ